MIRQATIYLFLLAFTFTFGCSDVNKKQSVVKSVLNTKTISPDSTIINFLKWYHDNESRLNKIQLVKGGYPDTTTFYRVDFSQTENYLAELKKSGFVSDKYLSDFRIYFSKADADLKKDPQNDGPPAWFDADLVMKSQDYDDVWNNLEKAKTTIKEITDNSAEVFIQFQPNYKMKCHFTKIGNSWLLDLLENEF